MRLVRWLAILFGLTIIVAWVVMQAAPDRAAMSRAEAGRYVPDAQALKLVRLSEVDSLTGSNSGGIGDPLWWIALVGGPGTYCTSGGCAREDAHVVGFEDLPLSSYVTPQPGLFGSADGHVRTLFDQLPDRSHWRAPGAITWVFPASVLTLWALLAAQGLISRRRVSAAKSVQLATQ